jgi:hypothetical protein
MTAMPYRKLKMTLIENVGFPDWTAKTIDTIENYIHLNS